jgi:hypothetical protein
VHPCHVHKCLDFFMWFGAHAGHEGCAE